MNESFSSLLQTKNQLLQLKEEQKEGDRFLKFPLSPEVNGLISLADLQGVINVTLKDILPVPEVKHFFLGIINCQGEAIWILDLANLLGATQWYQRKPPLDSGIGMLVRVESYTIGLLVEQANTIENYNLQELLPVSEEMLPNQMRTFLQGYFLDSQGKPRMLLDLNATIAFAQMLSKNNNTARSGSQPK